MHTTTPSKAALEPLPVRRRKFSLKNLGQYRVTAPGEEPRQIVASTAYEAFRLSGLKNAIKIERSFNPTQIIFEKAQLLDDTAAQDIGDAGEALHHNISLQRTHPVISADDLDTLMRYARGASPVEHPPEPVTEPLRAPAPAVSPPVIAPPAPPAATAMDPMEAITTTNPAGVEVHEDGFDELIPAAVALRPTPSKPADPLHAGTQAASSLAMLPPAQELSLEEVERLLGGKDPDGAS